MDAVLPPGRRDGSMTDVTRILSSIEQGDPQATELLLPLVYDELRRLATTKMAKESPDHTLQATALVHEAYLRLVDGSHPQTWKHRGHFFNAAAEAMRRILVERARHRGTRKRGGGAACEPFDEAQVVLPDPAEEVLAVHEVLDNLAASDPLSADLVKLRYFAGLTMNEAAEALGISTRKAHYLWAYARSWLRRELGEG